jgi:N-acyl amino acid synthase of PEP-CTERM/exosortase system
MPFRGSNHVRQNAQFEVPSATHAPCHSLYSDYDAMFKTRMADSQRLQEECFRIRHEVYCVERGFLETQLNSSGLERDSYDERSAHSLLYDRASGLAVGTIRLILAERGSPSPSTPFHDLCKNRLEHHPELLGLAQTAEVSRLALSKRRCDIASLANGHRRRSADLKDVHPSSYVALGLLRMAIEMAVRNRVDYLCCVMEPSLLRMLARCGIYFENLGQCIEYHGRRQPCYAHVITLLDGIKANRPDVWEIITDVGRFHPEHARNNRVSHQESDWWSTDPAERSSRRAAG